MPDKILRTRIFKRVNMPETGQLGQIGHSLAALKKRSYVYIWTRIFHRVNMSESGQLGQIGQKVHSFAALKFGFFSGFFSNFPSFDHIYLEKLLLLRFLYNMMISFLEIYLVSGFYLDFSANFIKF